MKNNQKNDNKKENLFWADQLAEQIIERAKKEGVIANIKCQQTPSGGKHIGNLNDVARAYFPYKSILEKGEKATFVHTTDDRDPLKDIPKKLPDLEGEWHNTSELKDITPFLGMPLCRIPDPFGCCNSWSEHFTKVWMDGVTALGMNPKLYSVNDLYLQGKFEPYIKMVFEKRKEVGAIIAKFQKTKSKNYIPFDAICSRCGRLANVDDFNMEEKTVHFICGGKAIKKKKSEGCGEEAWVPWSEGKLQWRFEWPALWGIFHTTFEPFGKDHAEGSWPSGQEIARKIYNIEPPIPFVYEFFLANGEKMSASVGNVYIVQDMLKIMEPEIFLYFYTKRPGRQRNLDLKNIYFLVDDFEHAERVYFGIEEENEKEKKSLSRMYEAAMQKIPEKPPIRIPYQFAAVVAQLGKADNAIELLKRTGHIKEDITEEDIESIKMRLWLAKNWVETFAPENKIEVNDKVPEEIKEKTKPFHGALFELADHLDKKMTEEQLYALFFEICEKRGIKTKDFFRAAYQILISKDSGPRLAPFILALGKERVRKIFQQL